MAVGQTEGRHHETEEGQENESTQQSEVFGQQGRPSGWKNRDGASLGAGGKRVDQLDDRTRMVFARKGKLEREGGEAGWLPHAPPHLGLAAPHLAHTILSHIIRPNARTAGQGAVARGKGGQGAGGRMEEEEVLEWRSCRGKAG